MAWWDSVQRVGKTGGCGTSLDTGGGWSGGDKALGQETEAHECGVTVDGTHEGPACVCTVRPAGPVGVGGWLGADRGRLAQRC